jgi:predicted amidohydrolase YtcJ
VAAGVDGGLEAGATEEPYACDHAYSGTLTWEPDALAKAVEAVIRRGWRVGTHAYGDRAVRILLDVYERVMRNNPGLPAGTLVMEHGGLAGAEQRARAVKLGIPVTSSSRCCTTRPRSSGSTGARSGSPNSFPPGAGLIRARR